MALIVPEQSQRPYRFGMTLLCIGALFNWLGLADSYTEPVPAVRYIGVVLIAVGAALICLAMCCWMRAVQDPQYAREIHVSGSVWLYRYRCKEVFLHENMKGRGKDIVDLEPQGVVSLTDI